ncbi:MAG: hypothetical protein ACMXYC_02575 [Candidatus Woesearchaeota archaeon]
MIRAQTSTEYLVITAIVIVISVIVVGVLGGILGIGGGTDERVTSAQLQTMPVGIINYNIGESDSVFILRNNQQQNIMVNEIVYGAQTCAVGRTVTPGHEIRVNCDNINSSLEQTAFFVEYQIQQAVYYVSSLGSTAAPQVNLEWVSYNTSWFTFNSHRAISGEIPWENPQNALVDDSNVAYTNVVSTWQQLGALVGRDDNTLATLSIMQNVSLTTSFDTYILGGSEDDWAYDWDTYDINSLSVTLFDKEKTGPPSEYYHQFYNASLTVPSDARIDGIEVRARARWRKVYNAVIEVQYVEARIHYSLEE